MNKYAFLGTLSLKVSKVKYKLRITPFIYISVPDLYSRGWYPNFELIKTLQKEAELNIIYPHFATKDEKYSLLKLAKELSKDKHVVVYEVAVELGGGADTVVREALRFVYQHYQPSIILGNISLGLFINYIYDLLKKIYKEKNNPILKSQFTIQRVTDNVRYNYIFDNLDKDTALLAGSLIPKKKDIKIEKPNSNSVYQDVYLCFIKYKKKWMQVNV